MIPQSISLVFFMLASALSCLVFMGGYLMQGMQPNNKWFYGVYAAGCVLTVLAGVFLHQSGFYLTVETGFK